MENKIKLHISIIVALLFAISDKLKGNSIFFKLFSFNDEFKADASSKETNNSEILNIQSLKYSISDNTHEMLLDNFCDPDKNFFDTDIQKYRYSLHFTWRP